MSLLDWFRRHPHVAPGGSIAGERDKQMMVRALDLARQAAALGEVPVGAVVYRNGEILGEGFNRREMDHNPAAHAEFLAIVEAARRLGDWRLNDCSLAVTLEPCIMCAGLIVNARVGRVLYGAVDPKAGACASLYTITSDRRLNHRPEVIAGLEAEASGAMLKTFFRGLRTRGDR
ncbi:MAG: nucleoside deaminase [Phycisphaeraceae bacterium]|nr:nucleoside deaminase [Phycisphaeraceae bacterium]MCW5753967.1 nucleoside deaminase [Phycisphaeraceae bacterium]